MNTRRAMLVLFLACLWVGSFRAEWSYAVPETSFVARVATAFGPVGVVLVAGLAAGALRLPRRAGRLSFFAIGGAVLIAVVLSHALLPGEFRGRVRPDFYLSLMLAVAGAMIGHWFAADVKDLRWGLSRIAAILAVLSVYGGLARLLNLQEISLLLVPGWPMGFFILFAYCWYLHDWLNRSRWSVRPLLGLAACVPEILFPPHKAVLFCVVVASTFLVCYSLWASLGFHRRTVSVVTRSVAVLVIGVAAAFGTDAMASGRFSRYVTEVALPRMLHEGARTRGETFMEAVSRISGNRLYLWEQGFARFTTSPVVGVGFGQEITGELSQSEEGPRTPRISSVYVHNGYLDLLLSVGILGTVPIAIGVVWWFRVALRRELARRMGYLVIPCVAYVVAIFAQNMGEASRVFFSLNAFTLFFMGAVVRLSDGLSAAAPMTRRGRPATLFRPPATAARGRNPGLTRSTPCT